MALVTIDHNKHRWLITPENIIERSALLQLPAKKWMSQMNMFIAGMLPGNARSLREMLDKKQLAFPSDHEAEIYESIQDILKPARQDRQFPTWYTFNTDKFPPAEHQIDALKRVYPVDAGALLMEMGTMKTRVAIDLMTAHFYERRIQFVIVVAPLTVKMSTWVDELANYSPCPYNFIDVDSDFIAANFRPLQDRLQWLVVGVESLSQGKTFKALAPLTKLGVPYACVVDESSRIANWKAICTQAAFDLRRNAAIKLIMTGSEIKKNIEDLYAQFEFLDPNVIGVGDYYAFRNRYCIMGGYKNKEIIGYNHIEELMGLIAPHVYQCTKDILKLPPKLYEKRIVELSPEQKKLYQQIKKGEAEKISTKNVLTKILRLQQVSSGYWNTDATQTDIETGKKIKVPVETHEVVPPSRNPKLREILAIAREVSHPMIIWVQSMYECQILEAALSKLGEVVKIIGDTPKEERNGIVQRFQTGRVPYFIGTEAAGGIGITLTAARTVVYFSNSQRFGDRVQSEDRAHRKGQTGSVTIIDLVAKSTVDVVVLANHREKSELANYVKAALKNRLALDLMYDGQIDEQLLYDASMMTGPPDQYDDLLNQHEPE